MPNHSPRNRVNYPRTLKPSATENGGTSGAAEVSFVITGEWVDRDGDEDIACADYIEALLRGDSPAPADYARRVRESDFGRRFTAGTWPNLPLADLDLAAQADLFDFAMPVRREGADLVIRPAYCRAE